ncbi:MAG: ASKHA domain-containing protein [Candidatus Aerophobetes bacterium]|nr:ASKHA domain-containing protein [Candidatus Aerophobetes bacterium]
MKFYQIDFEPIGRQGRCLANQSLLDCAHQLGVKLASICGGQGECHCCKVQVLSGSVSKPTSNERNAFSSQELKDGYRLACQTYVTSDCQVRIPLESLTAPQRIQVEGQEVSVHREPSVSSYHIQVSSPSLSDLRGDEERVIERLNHEFKLHCNDIDMDVLRKSLPLLRSWNWEAQISLRNQEVIAINSWPSRQLGLAIDLGTTKIAGYLLDLSSGQTLAAEGIMNPQISYGEDIVSRITYAMESSAKAIKLQQVVVEVLNQLAANLCRKTNTKLEEILEVVIVGNTAMHHLFLHLPIEQLASSPFVPAVRKALDVKARDIGLNIAPGAYIYLLPNIAGFVGADHVAMLLATEQVRKDQGLMIAIDIGTNTEVSLIDDGEISSVSCASGPAFEGAHIKDGMRAANGAIERLQLINDQIKYETIGGLPPVGLCGSGIVDTIAQLYLVGVLDKSGRMGNHPRVRTYKGQREFILTSEEEQNGRPAITITQKDVREIQLAKGAIRAGIQVLLQTKNHSREEIKKVIIAGAFGSYIDVGSAVTIGMLPRLSLDRFRQVGNAAGMGAKLALISRSERARTKTIAHRVHYIELAAAPHFEEIFTQAMYLG